MVMSVNHEHLVFMLNRLKLTTIRDRLDSLLDEASRKDLNIRETLAFLCEQEIGNKNQKRNQMGLSIAKFPSLKST